MNNQQKKKLYSIVRIVIQLLYFIFIPSVFTAAFAGVKYIFTRLGMGEPIELTSFVTVLLVICGYTFVFGRFFCGYACAFGTLGDGVHAVYVKVCKKLKKKPVQIKTEIAAVCSYLKYVVLLVIALLCFAGVYGETQGYSPWDVFSMLHAGNFKLEKYGLGILLLICIIAGMCIQERFFCRFFCPMGAVFALLPVLPAFALSRERENCINGCQGCKRQCPASIELPESRNMSVTGECIRCQKCISTCPKSNIHCGIEKIKGNEVWFTLLRALLLCILLLCLGV